MSNIVIIKIVCAACRDNTTGVIYAGARHMDNVMRSQIQNAKEYNKHDSNVEQGFIDQFGNFYGRTQAWHIAQATGQIVRRCGGDTANGGTLYSENLY